MRTVLSSMFMTLALGCTSEGSWIQHTSMIETRSRGVEFTEDGNFADIGMVGNTCRFDFRAGVIGGDADFAQGEDDIIQDAYGSRVVVKGTTGVYVVDDWLQNPATPEMQGQNVIAARLTNTSYAVLAESGEECNVTWGDGTTSKLGTKCPDTAGFSIDRISGSVFLATELGTFVMTQDGHQDLNVDSDMLAWNSNSQTLYTSKLNSGVITATGVDGFEKWSVETEGIVTSIDDLGTSDGVVVMVGRQDGGEILILDSETGSMRERAPTPSPADRILASPGGDSLAVVIESEIHFFSINTSF